MTFEEKLRNYSAKEIWQEYCSFLDLSMDEYMTIQKRLLMEQVDLMSRCPLGQRFFRKGVPATVEEFRKMVGMIMCGILEVKIRKDWLLCGRQFLKDIEAVQLF